MEKLGKLINLAAKLKLLNLFLICLLEDVQLYQHIQPKLGK